MDLFLDTIFTFLSVKTKINKNRLNSINLKKLLTATRLSMWLNYFECDAIRTVFQLFWKLHSHNSVLRRFYRKPGKTWKTKTWKSWETFVFRFLLFFQILWNPIFCMFFFIFISDDVITFSVISVVSAFPAISKFSFWQNFLALSHNIKFYWNFVNRTFFYDCFNSFSINS